MRETDLLAALCADEKIGKFIVYTEDKLLQRLRPWRARRLLPTPQLLLTLRRICVRARYCVVFSGGVFDVYVKLGIFEFYGIRSRNVILVVTQTNTYQSIFTVFE